jgi:hypothetical protein
MEFDGDDLTVGAEEISTFEALCTDVPSWSTALLMPLLFGFLLQDLHVRQQKGPGPATSNSRRWNSTSLRVRFTASTHLGSARHWPGAQSTVPDRLSFKAKSRPYRQTEGCFATEW